MIRPSGIQRGARSGSAHAHLGMFKRHVCSKPAYIYLIWLSFVGKSPEVCRSCSSYRQTFSLDPIASQFLNLETSATRLARVLLVGYHICNVIDNFRFVRTYFPCLNCVELYNLNLVCKDIGLSMVDLPYLPPTYGQPVPNGKIFERHLNWTTNSWSLGSDTIHFGHWRSLPIPT